MEKLEEKPNRILSALKIYAEWESRANVRNTLTNINWNLEEIRKEHPLITSKGGVPLLYDGESVYVDAGDSHTLILGSTGSRKTRLLVLPTVHLLARAEESMIITDPKAEVYGRTAAMLEKEGYSVGVFNFRNPSFGDGWNPLEIPYRLYVSGETDRANEFVNDIAQNIMLVEKSQKDVFWDYAASDLFVGLILYTFRKFKDSNRDAIPSLSDVLELRADSFSGDEADEIFVENARRDSLTYHALIGTITAKDRTQASILSVFDQKVRVFLFQNDLVQMMKRNTHPLDAIGDRKSAIFVIMPDEKTTYHRLISLFIKQSYEYLIFQAQNRESSSFPVRINYLLDEFSTLPTIADFPAMITAARSRNIRFDLVVQSQKQLVARYGDEAETIKSNCNNWVFLTSRELSLLEEISMLAGKLRDGSPLISVYALQHFDKEMGEALILSNRLSPFVSKLEDISYYDHDQYEHRTPKRRIDAIASQEKMTTLAHSMEESLKDEDEFLHYRRLFPDTDKMDADPEDDELFWSGIDDLKGTLDKTSSGQTEYQDDGTETDIDEEDNIVVLNDENGEEQKFEFLDLIEYDGNEYVVLLPVVTDEVEDAGEVVILQIEESEDEDTESYVSVDDDVVLQMVFDIFKERFKDEFRFIE